MMISSLLMPGAIFIAWAMAWADSSAGMMPSVRVVTWKASYGYRRIPRSAATGAAHHEIYEPEAAVVRRIFTDRAAGITVREICRRLNADGVASPTGKPTWGHSTLCRLLRNQAYIGRVRELARTVAKAYYESREKLGFPMAHA